MHSPVVWDSRFLQQMARHSDTLWEVSSMYSDGCRVACGSTARADRTDCRLVEHIEHKRAVFEVNPIVSYLSKHQWVSIRRCQHSASDECDST